MSLKLSGGLAARGDVALGDRCGIDRAMGLVGNRTAILLLREAFYGVTRFDALTKRVGVTEAVAAQRLKELVAAGVLAKRPYKEVGQRTRDEYVLTESGHALLPVVIGLLEWGTEFVSSDHPPVEVTHLDCGEPVRVELRCAGGHQVTEDEVRVHGRR